MFFREVRVEGVGHIPTDRGGLFVAAHPNGLVDPALILAAYPGHVVFGARRMSPMTGRVQHRMAYAQPTTWTSTTVPLIW